MRPRVLVSKHVYPEAIEYLRDHVDVDYHDSSDGLSPEELVARVADKDGLISQLTDPVDASLMDAAANLKVISNVAVGFDNIDIPAATARKILVTHTPDVLSDTTADFAFALLMAAARRVVEADKFLRAGKFRRWEIDMLCGTDIHDARLGLIGVGRIGQEMARRGHGFGMEVVYHDVEHLPAELERELNVSFVTLDELIATSDFISLHVPLMEKTRHLICKERLEQMKRTAIVINTARGPVIDEAALAEALASGEIGGAGLDVYEREPEIHPRLLELDNVVLAPHIASASVATRTRMCMMAAENCVAVLRGEAPPNPVNGELL